MIPDQDSTRAPTIRVRIAHEHTAKGWRTKETTVEVDGPAQRVREGDVTWLGTVVSGAPQGYVGMLSELMRHVDERAHSETMRRNRRDHPDGAS